MNANQNRGHHLRIYALVCVVVGAVILMSLEASERQWLAGDSHVHSHWSPGYDRTTEIPRILKGRDAIYSTPKNALMAERYGLSWIVTTDHGGPNHSKFNAEQAYPELQRSRNSVSDVLQFYGMELNMPGMDHHTLIVPQVDDEQTLLFQIENRYDKSEVWPVDSERDTEIARVRALNYMKQLPHLPLLFANHPSRSATGIREYGYNEPSELRANNELAPMLYRGMEGAPGHQAAALTVSTVPSQYGFTTKARGAYRNEGAQTLGGFDQMTAIVGGLWDSLLGEGRRFWIVASSDSHVHYTENSRPGLDFWPGEFHKTYVHAEKTYSDVLNGLRSGRIFAVAGDLITELNVTAEGSQGSSTAGETLRIDAGSDVTVHVDFIDPDTPNENGDTPTVTRVDLIVGKVRSQSNNLSADTNDTTRVVERFTPSTWVRDGNTIRLSTILPNNDEDIYVRVRGTNGNDLEPVMDVPGEDPWSDLWFYSNPIFIEVD